MYSLSHNHLSDDAISELATCLAENETLTGILLDGNNVGDSGAAHLGEVLVKNKKLQRLRFGIGKNCRKTNISSLADNGFTASGGMEIGKYLFRNPQLLYLGYSIATVCF